MIKGTIKTCKKIKLSREKRQLRILSKNFLYPMKKQRNVWKCIGSMWHMVIEEPGGMTSGSSLISLQSM